MSRTHLTALLAAACAGLAAWVSMGALGIGHGDAGMTRLGLLPPLWLLALLVPGFMALAWAVRLTPAASLPLFFSLVLEVDGAKQTLVLGPGDEQLIPVSPAAGQRAALIRIETSAGFRPSEVEPGSTDARFLGVWLEFR